MVPYQAFGILMHKLGQQDMTYVHVLVTKSKKTKNFIPKDKKHKFFHVSHNSITSVGHKT
jgi:hypothetical protein